jgi:hypothetical protein
MARARPPGAGVGVVVAVSLAACRGSRSKGERRLDDDNKPRLVGTGTCCWCRQIALLCVGRETLEFVYRRSFFSCLGNDTLLPKQLPECQGNSRVQSVVARASQPGLIDRPPRQVERDRVQARCPGPFSFRCSRR